MYIKELQLTGFKSFQEKTTLRLSPGMNAIIGPNGCGKTNILDALRWVLGEQSFSLLRCGRNEDLIFGGTAEVPPVNYADVKLVLENNELPQYPTEIEIRRRYFRTGESEYYLNRQPCRQKDIQEVFLASGIGTKAYSIFDLRQMREIIAGNIRKMFEEASTLAKYQEAKADCERKLALTDADLTRLNDIVAERERVVRSLRYQLGKQRSWEKLKEEEKSYRLVELKAEYISVCQELERLVRERESLEQADAERLVEISRLEEALHQQRGRLREEQSLKDELADRARTLRTYLSELEGKELIGNERVRSLRMQAAQAEEEAGRLARSLQETEPTAASVLERLAEATSLQGRLEATLQEAQEETRAAETRLYTYRTHEQSQRQTLLALLQKQQELERRLAYEEAVRQNMAEAEARAKVELQELEQRLAECRKAEEEAVSNAAAAGAQLEQMRQEVSSGEAELAKVAAELKQVTEELVRAREKRNRLERELAALGATAPDRSAQCRSVLGDSLLGEVSSFLSVTPGWERACEAALYPLLEFLVTREEPSVAVLRQLSEAGLEAWCGFVLPGSEDTSSTSAEAIGVRLSQYVQVQKGAPALLRNLLDSFFVVDAGDDGWKPGRNVVSREGWAVYADGRFVVAAAENGPLRVQACRTQKTAELQEAVAQVEKLETRRQERETRRMELERKQEEARALVEEAGEKKALADARREAATARRQELERELARVRQDTVRSRGESERQSLESVQEELEAVRRQVAEQTDFVQKAERAVREQEQIARAALERAAEQLAALSEQKQRVSRLETEVAYVRRELQERRNRLAELQRTAEKLRQEADSLEQETAGLKPELERVREELADLETKIGELKVTDLTLAEEELERNLTELRKAREQGQSVLMELRLREYELNTRRQAIEQEARGEYGTDIASFESSEVEDVVNRLAQVRQRLAALGAVNPLAREEYERERKDLELLINQRNDVLAAKENLLQSLKEIDRHARDRFLETYNQVRTHFRDIFRQMFLEGEADLVLVDESRPLESEVAIIAKPKGKMPKRLEQLSDGEKALLAVSLLFAFYRVKPAPFCFLDEIDAPLDDANTGRFADYLKELSKSTQVIVITHNRLTVERADALFGVTAEQPGVSKLISVSLANYRSSPAAVAVS